MQKMKATYFAYNFQYWNRLLFCIELPELTKNFDGIWFDEM